MESLIVDYLRDWWNGALTGWYVVRVPVHQVNKLSKIGQYLTGLMAIFDIIRYTEAIRAARTATVLSAWAFFLWRAMSDVLQISAIAMVALVRSVVAWRNPLKAAGSAISAYFRRAGGDAVEAAENNVLTRALLWLENHPIPDHVFRRLNFIGFVIFSATEILTS